jgi:hypothetical protein
MWITLNMPALTIPTPPAIIRTTNTHNAPRPNPLFQNIFYVPQSREPKNIKPKSTFFLSPFRCLLLNQRTRPKGLETIALNIQPHKNLTLGVVDQKKIILAYSNTDAYFTCAEQATFPQQLKTARSLPTLLRQFNPTSKTDVYYTLPVPLGTSVPAANNQKGLRALFQQHSITPEALTVQS